MTRAKALTTVAIITLFGVLSITGAPRAQTPAPTPAPPAATEEDTSGELLNDLELTRSAIGVRRQALVTAAMDLDGGEAAKFWPVYRDYRHAIGAVNDRYVKLVAKYLDSFDKLTDDAATSMLKEYRSIERARLDVKNSYIAKFGKAIPPRKVVRFFQIDNRLDTVVSAEMARMIPLAR